VPASCSKVPETGRHLSFRNNRACNQPDKHRLSSVAGPGGKRSDSGRAALRLISSCVRRLVCLAAAPGRFSQTTNLNYRIIDAEFSSSLNRLVSVSALPNRVNLYDPGTRTTVSSLPPPQVPTCVSVSPDGRSAVVGHDGYVSVVDLTRPAVPATFQARVDVLDIVHRGNGFAYLSPGAISGRRFIPYGLVTLISPGTWDDLSNRVI
jgi:hypothetical protein